MQRQPGDGASGDDFSRRRRAPQRCPRQRTCHGGSAAARKWSSEPALAIRLYVIRLCTVLPVLILSLLPVRQARALDCTGTVLLECDDQNECTADACDLTTHTCTNTPITGSCDDGDPCTQNLCDPTTGCRFPTVEGVVAVSCALDVGLPGCAGSDLPRGIQRRQNGRRRAA